MKVIYIDVETTSVNSEESYKVINNSDMELKPAHYHIFFGSQSLGKAILQKPPGSIIQLAGIIVIDGEEKERFNFNMRPLIGSNIEDGALEVNGVTREELETFPPATGVCKDLMGIFKTYVSPYDKRDKFTMRAYNAGFDEGFIYHWFRALDNYGIATWVHRPAVCVMQKAARILQGTHLHPINFKLKTVAEALGIDTSEINFHDAMADIDVTMQIDKLLDLPFVTLEARRIPGSKVYL